jgi:hypothetical protein
MRHYNDFSDDRYKGTCLHCGAALATKPTNDDHVPSKALLDRPLPANVHVIATCVQCNNGFSSDEEYFAAFLGAAMSGSTNPEAQVFETARKVLARNAKLQREIEATRTEGVDSDGNPRLTWLPDLDRIRRVVVKNARVHAFHELGQPMLEEPDDVLIAPLEVIDEERLANFLTVDLGPGWPEVGSRLLQRLYEGGADMAGGWIIVQPGVYVFAVIETDGVIIRSIIREYLLTEVAWRR